MDMGAWESSLIFTSNSAYNHRFALLEKAYTKNLLIMKSKPAYASPVL
jgi:hypothetical protein